MRNVGSPRSASVRARFGRSARTHAWKALRHTSQLDDQAYLDRLSSGYSTTIPAGALLDELRQAPELTEVVTSEDAVRWRSRGASEFPPRAPIDEIEDLYLRGTAKTRALLLYAALRRRRPSLVVETGCFTGSDTVLVLLALTRNAHGHLYTVDLPGYADNASPDNPFQASLPAGGLPHDLRPGFLVPDGLRERWTLRLGDARDLLPKLLRDLNAPVDAFFHDSEHSYGHMMWEYTTVAPHLAPGALLASDDISFNTAYWDFCAGFGLERLLHRGNANIGAAIWRAQPR